LRLPGQGAAPRDQPREPAQRLDHAEIGEFQQNRSAQSLRRCWSRNYR
jgi:hypothetical protein